MQLLQRRRRRRLPRRLVLAAPGAPGELHGFEALVLEVRPVAPRGRVVDNKHLNRYRS